MPTAWRRLAGVTVTEPYFEWARRNAFRYYWTRADERPARLAFPVIMDLAIPAANFERGDWGHTRPPADWRQVISVPASYGRPPPGLEATSYCTATVREDFFDRLVVDPALRAVIRRIELALPVGSEVSVQRNLPRPEWPPGSVVTGVVDDGLAFAHARLRDGSEPRMQYLWNQDGSANPPQGFDYGLDLTKTDTAGGTGMKSQMEKNTFAKLVDEQEVYRKTGHMQMQPRRHKSLAARGAHGTHVLDAAAGAHAATVGSKRPLIGVQLPVRTTADTSGGSLTRYALDGVRYILERATKVPVAVNLSYALIAGPHDGSSILERALDQLIQLRRAAGLPFAVVLPAGNHHLSRCHARFRTSAKPRRMRWRVLPDDATPSFLELWLPHVPATAKVAVRVRTPTGDISPPITEGQTWVWRPDGQVLAEVVYFVAPGPGLGRNMVLVAIAPTVSENAARAPAPAGTWSVEVQKDGKASWVDAWIQRDDTAFGYRQRGRQSRFEDDAYERFTDGGSDIEEDNAVSYVKRDGTINPMATGRETVVVGGMHRKDWRAAKYSAAGPVIRPPGRGAPTPLGPDVLTVSDDGCAHHGILAAGSLSGSCVRMDGTSVAAPQITRWIVAQMARGLPYDRQAVAQFAQTGVAPRYRTEANPPPGAVPQQAAKRGGAGRIEPPPLVDPGIER
ncbi:MAG TPA: hypothetical protein VM183_18845 [Burkholderiales bacterium]|nr:hypothetical protein [Burkholderiales bacterium]